MTPRIPLALQKQRAGSRGKGLIRVGTPPPPSYLDEPERQVWQSVVGDNLGFVTSSGNLQLLTVALQAHATIRHLGGELQALRRANRQVPRRMFETMGKALKSYTNILTALDVIRSD